MIMERYNDDILKRLDINDSERKDWYYARQYVLDVLPPLDRTGIEPSSSTHVHVVTNSTDNLMLAIIRQICLIAHYPNFNEETGANRTIITICTKNPSDALNKIKAYRYLGNLLKYCKISFVDNDEKSTIQNESLPLDIEFEFSPKTIDSYKESDGVYLQIIKIEDIKDSINVQECFDVTKGMLVNMVYTTGSDIDNLPASDYANIERYSIALNMFCYKLKHEVIREKWNDTATPDKNGNYDKIKIKNQLSSIFCADCFESKLRAILDVKEKTILEYLHNDFYLVMKELCKKENITALACCEHARWNVEKLIMEFSPLSPEDWYKIECSFGTERNKIVTKLKKAKENPKHIDLCSCRNLRRVNPANMKYDYFLMLAMPQIIISSEE